MSSHSWFDGLNPEQKEAVAHNYGPMLILAGAGSGKTTVLVARTGRMIEDEIVKPSEVCVLTFTNKSARELKERVGKRLGKMSNSIWAGTFHSFGLEILRKHYRLAGLPESFGVCDSQDTRAVVKEVLRNTNHCAKADFDPEKILSRISLWREKGQSKACNEDSRDDDPYDEITEMVMPRYLSRMQALGVVDFDGLLLKPLELFRQHPEILQKWQSRFQQVMVDEFQDTNHMQMELIRLLVKQHQNISVVGDDDQSIYGWRGAVVKNILEFPKKFEPCHVVRLERNYRSQSTILDVANSIIQKNKKRHSKILRAEKKSSAHQFKPEVFYYDNDEIEVEEVVEQIRYFHGKGYRFRDIAVLYRSNSQGGLLEAQLRRNSLPYALTGGSTFFERKEVKDVMGYLRALVRPHEITLRRIVNTPARGLGTVSLKLIADWCHEKKVSFDMALKSWDAIGLKPRCGKAIESFYSDLERFQHILMQQRPIEDFNPAFMQFFKDIGYQDLIHQSYKETQTAHRKWQLLEVVAQILRTHFEKDGKTLASLKSFIDSMDLRDQIDESAQEKDEDKVQLLTLHACKGLEFPCVIIMGLEEEILPHRTLGSDIDEERRLFYVGVTRAQERLVMTLARQRRRFGKMRPSSPSRFLIEVPRPLLEIHDNGFRPVSETERKSLLDGLMLKLEQKSKQNTGPSH